MNFGTRDLCGLISTHMDLGDLEHDIAEAIRRFEPRINPRTIEVKANPGSRKGDAMRLSIEIRGKHWAYPIPEELYLRTQLDLDSGEYTI